jgi:hypothetical protein
MDYSEFHKLPKEMQLIYSLTGLIQGIVDVGIEIESLSGEMLDALDEAIAILKEVGDPLNQIPSLQATAEEADEEKSW